MTTLHLAFGTFVQNPRSALRVLCKPRQTCGKLAFRTRHAAMVKASRIAAGMHGKGFSIYHCPRCGMYHLTKSARYKQACGG
jgi:hypothetical protein